MPLPIYGLPKFPAGLLKNYTFTENLSHDVVSGVFQSGISSRTATTSNKVKSYNLVLKVLKQTDMNTLELFYNEIGGPLKPFIFDPPIEEFSRYVQLLSNGSQILSNFLDGRMRVGSQRKVVHFTSKFSRTLFKVLLEKTGLRLDEVVGENPLGNYLHFDGLTYAQTAKVPNYLQDYFDFEVNDDFMIDFMIRGETIFHSLGANYASLNGKTLIFAIDGNDYTVTFTAGAIDAASVIAEINAQQGDAVEAQVFGTSEFRVRSIVDTGYFTVSGTAHAQLNFAAPVVKIISKHDGVDTGYYFEQDGIGDLTFFLESGGTGKTITADSDFHVFDGSWHYVAVVIDYDGNGQIYADGATSGSTTAIGSIGSLANDADFYFNEDANMDYSLKRVGVWSWNSDLGQLPSNIATRISTFNSDLFRIDTNDESGLKALWSFDKANGVDIVNGHELTMINLPTFHDFESGMI